MPAPQHWDWSSLIGAQVSTSSTRSGRDKSPCFSQFSLTSLLECLVTVTGTLVTALPPTTNLTLFADHRQHGLNSHQSGGAGGDSARQCRRVRVVRPNLCEAEPARQSKRTAEPPGMPPRSCTGAHVDNQPEARACPSTRKPSRMDRPEGGPSPCGAVAVAVARWSA